MYTYVQIHNNYLTYHVNKIKKKNVLALYYPDFNIKV